MEYIRTSPIAARTPPIFMTKGYIKKVNKLFKRAL